MIQKKKMFIVAAVLIFGILLAGVIIFLTKGKFNADENPISQISETETAQPTAAGELLVKFKEGVTKDKKDKFYSKHSAKVKKEIAPIDVKVLEISSENPEFEANRIRKVDSDILSFVEPNYLGTIATIPPNDPLYSTNQTALAEFIQEPAGWNVTTGSASTILAMLDTGIELTHPDLQSKILPGYDFANSDSDPADDNGHGTATSGVAAAIGDNNLGVAGVSWGTKILPIKICTSGGSCSYSNMASGITYAVDHGANVINISVGGASSSSTLQNAVDYAISKGVVVVAAAGNSGASANYVYYPAGCRNVIAVGEASIINGAAVRSTSSNYGNMLDIMAITTNLWTTKRGGSYGATSGTSNASPVVAGMAALIKSINPNFTVQQVTDYITKYATDMDAPGRDNYTGWGYTNFKSSLEAAAAGSTPVTIQNSINGNITSSTLTPVPSALIEARQGTSLIGSTKSLTDGSYSLLLDIGTYDITVSAPGYISKTTKGIIVNASASTSGISFELLETPSDTVAPVVQITAPLANSNISIGSRMAIKAVSSDDVGVAKVMFYINNVLKSTVTTGTAYSYTFNTRKNAPGLYNVTVKSYDAAGNIGTSSINVNLVK